MPKVAASRHWPKPAARYNPAVTRHARQPARQAKKHAGDDQPPHTVEQWLRKRRRHRWVVGLAILTAVLTLSGLDHAGLGLDPGDDYQRYDGLSMQVLRVIDGDTLELANPLFGRWDEPATLRVRLWGINAPETAKPKYDKPAEPGSEQAHDLLTRLAHGQTVTLWLEPHHTRGVFDRLLAFVELPDGTLANEHLLTAGWASYEPRWSHRLIERFELLELGARREKRGLFADD